MPIRKFDRFSTLNGQKIAIYINIYAHSDVCRPNQNHIQMLNEQRKNSKSGKGGLDDEPLLDWENYYTLVSYIIT